MILVFRYLLVRNYFLIIIDRCKNVVIIISFELTALGHFWDTVSRGLWIKVTSLNNSKTYNKIPILPLL